MTCQISQLFPINSQVNESSSCWRWHPFRGDDEYCRLMKGIGMKQDGKSQVQGCDTFHFIRKNQVPKGKKVTYARFCCDIRPQKEEKNRTRMTVGGGRLEYDGEITTETSTIETAKILINSTISTDGARFACWDVGNFYTNSRLDKPEYM